MLVLMVDVGERFWPAFVSMAGWIVFVVFTLFYTQVGFNKFKLAQAFIHVTLTLDRRELLVGVD